MKSCQQVIYLLATYRQRSPLATVDACISHSIFVWESFALVGVDQFSWRAILTSCALPWTMLRILLPKQGYRQRVGGGL